jgi:hypothetical protein
MIQSIIGTSFKGYVFEESGLILKFDHISNVNNLVEDSSNVGDWNIFFDLPNLGSPFTSVQVIGKEVNLIGGVDIYIKDSIFISNTSIVQVIDSVGCVTSAGEYSFYGCTSLTIVDLPLLTTANNDCFWGCTSLTSISLPELQTAGILCFYYCTSLTTINFPLLTTANNDCFHGCDSLTTISLPQLITAGNSCFQGCTSLTSISLSQLITTGELCFYNCYNLATFDLPNLTTAGRVSFGNCTSLTSISLPQLTTTGDAFFFNCTSLTTISLPLCTDLGGSVGNNNVFLNITGKTITLTIPTSLMTCNSGSPDGDIQYLQSNNIFGFFLT